MYLFLGKAWAKVYDYGKEHFLEEMQISAVGSLLECFHVLEQHAGMGVGERTRVVGWGHIFEDLIGHIKFGFIHSMFDGKPN